MESQYTAKVLLIVVLAEVYFVGATKWPTPPKWQDKAAMARYLVHYGDWGIVSAMSPEYGQPFGTLQSYADGPLVNSTGNPYFYIASISDTYNNIAYNNSVSLTVSQAEDSYCERMEFDPEEPTCARVTLVGKIVKVADADDAKFAKDSLFSRHPAMKDWPTGHDWRFYKMTLKAVHLLDFYGGASHVSLEDYYAAKPNSNQLSAQPNRV